MYISTEDSSLLIVASNLVASYSNRHGLDQNGLVKETIKVFKMLKSELEKEQG